MGVGVGGSLKGNSTSNTDRIVHTTAFVTPVVEHLLEREIAEWSTIKYR